MKIPLGRFLLKKDSFRIILNTEAVQKAVRVVNKKMSLSTDGLIIKVNNVGEYNRAVSVLTADKGIVHAFVHGARSVKNKHCAATALLSYSRLTFRKKGDTYTITESSPEKVFINLWDDIEKLTLAQHFCDLALALAPVEDEAEEYFRLILNSIALMADGKRDARLLKAVTELRILSISGYTPDLVACRNCAKFEDEQMFFDPVNGELYCSECRPATGGLIAIGNGVLTAMRHIIYSEFSDIYNFSLPESTLDVLSGVTERFLLSQVEHRFSALEFYKNL